MNRSHLMRWMCCLVLALASSSFADPPLRYAPQDGILLLRNGQVLRGKVSCLGDRYVVALPSGEVRVKTEDVEMQCRDLTEGYHRKRALIESHNVQHHLDLAQWCMNHDLLGYAADEIRDALTLEPTHPRIALLERRLKLVRQKPAIVKAVFESADAGPTTDELDLLTRGMPPGAMEVFTNSIQPLLLNNCTSAGCHGPGGENMHRWVRVSIGRTSSRRLTQRNLHTTLQLINREQPGESPLLVEAIRAHGTAKAPAFSDRQAAQFRQLSQWVHQVSSRQAPQQPSSVASQSSTLSQNLPRGDVRPASFEKEAVDTTTSSTDPAEPLALPDHTAAKPIRAGTLPHRSEPKRGEIDHGFAPKDPFDPEIFNRRYFPDK